MFLQASVILSTGRGVCLSACWDTTPPPGSRHPPPRSRHTHTPRTRLPPLGADTPPPGPDPPGSRHPPGADPPCQQAAGTHPTGMHSCYTCQSVMLFTRGRGCYDVTSCYGQYPPPGQHLQTVLMPPPESEQPPPPFAFLLAILFIFNGSSSSYRIYMGLSGFNLLGTFIFRMVIEDLLVYLDKDPHNSSARLYNDGCFVIYTY